MDCTDWSISLLERRRPLARHRVVDVLSSGHARQARESAPWPWTSHRSSEWLKSKEANRVCGASGGGLWQVLPNINFMPEMQGGAMRAGSGFPVVTVVRPEVALHAPPVNAYDLGGSSAARLTVRIANG